MVFNNSNRALVGLLLVITVFVSFILNFDFLLIALVLALITYDFYKVKVIENYLIFSLLTITLLLIFFCPVNIFRNLFILDVILILIILFSNKFKNQLFTFSIYIFYLILFYIVNINRDIFYIIIFVSFFNDTIAYLFGKNIGGPLITPSISPNKTWSGTTISFLLTTIILVLLNFNFIFSAIIALFLFLGDIFFSYIKRHLNIKDFSSLLGGHGGILDRLDSMFFVVIIFQIYLVIFL